MTHFLKGTMRMCVGVEGLRKKYAYEEEKHWLEGL